MDKNMLKLWAALTIAIFLIFWTGCTQKAQNTNSTASPQVQETAQPSTGGGETCHGGVCEYKGPEGNVKVDGADSSIKESDFNVKFYPGAQVADKNSSEAETPKGKFMIKNVSLNTQDDIEKVKSFYKDQIKNPIVVEDPENGITITSANTKPNDFVTVGITKDEENSQTNINITQSSTKEK